MPTNVTNVTEGHRTFKHLFDVDRGCTVELDPGESADVLIWDADGELVELPEDFQSGDLRVNPAKDLTVPELRAQAEALGLEVPAKATKAAITKAIADAKAAAEGEKTPDTSDDDGAEPDAADKTPASE